MRQRRYLQPFILGGTLLAVSALHAADLPRAVYKAPPRAEPVRWTGCYIGAQAGYGFGAVSSPTPGVPFVSNEPDGAVGGGQIAATIRSRISSSAPRETLPGRG